MSLLPLSPKKPLGEYIGVYLSRAIDPKIRRQRVGSGGAITAFLCYLIDKNIIDGAVTVRRVRGLEGEVVVATTKKEVLEAAGDKWSIIPFTARLRDTIEEKGLKRIAVVGLPCQIQFLGQMRMFPLLESDFSERISLLISLFCLGTFANEVMLSYLRSKYGIKPSDITDIRLEGENLSIYHECGKISIPAREIVYHLQTGCLVCTDYTGVLSDISAGISENYLGYTVLIARNNRALELLNNARDEKYIELKEAPPSVIEEISLKARGKMERATYYATRLL